MSITTIAAKAAVKLKAAGPDILVVGGIVGVIAGTAMIVKNAKKGSEIIDNGREKLEGIEKEPEHKSEIRKVKIDTAKQLAKVYGPWIGLEAVSICSILYGHKLIKGRLLAVTTAYKALDESYRQLNDRLKNEVGEVKAGKLKNGIHTEEIETTETDDKGKEKTKKETVNVAVPEGVSVYAKFFEEGSRYFHKDPTLNLMFLKNKQDEFTRLLHKRGYVTLNEVYSDLDIPTVKEFGTNVGWVKNHGDNKVDFDIYNIHKKANIDFVNGYEPCILLDFNVDSVDISSDLMKAL